jgi:hypothetical protein
MKKSLLVAGAVFAFVGVAKADETLKVKTFSHLVSVNSQDVGDVPGHTLTLFVFRDLCRFPMEVSEQVIGP